MTQPINHTSPEDVPQEIVKVPKKSVLREYTEAILVALGVSTSKDEPYWTSDGAPVIVGRVPLKRYGGE